MDYFTLWALLGFMFAVYAVTANDSIQTLGTYISSNADVKWYWMFAFMGSIFVLTMMNGFNVGDPAFGRLDKFPDVQIQWYHAVAPLILIVLTRLKIPVSTTFLVLSVFASSFIMEKMLVKSFLGYAVSFVIAWAEDGLLLSIGKDITAKIDERADKGYATQVYYCMSIGATRMEEEKVVEIKCRED